MATQEPNEEPGAISESLESLGTFDLTNGSANHRAHFFLARNVEIATSSYPDHLEEIREIREFSRHQILDAIWDGTLRRRLSVRFAASVRLA